MCVYVCVYRSVSVSERRSQSVALSQQPHALFQLHVALPVCRGELGSDPGADHTCAAGAAHCQPTSSVGSSRHLHRAHQEPAVQVLASRVCPLRTGNWKVCFTWNVSIRIHLCPCCIAVLQRGGSEIYIICCIVWWKTVLISQHLAKLQATP